MKRLLQLEKVLPKIGWFEAAGQSLTEDDKTNVHNYLGSLEVKHRHINRVKDWQTARKVASRNDWAPAWWKTETRLGSTLTAESKTVLGDSLFHARMTQIASKVFDPVPHAVSKKLLSLKIKDETIIKSATGAATEAVHQAALGTIKVSNNNNPFLYKFQIFRAGHWPLGVYNDTFFIL